MKIQFIIYLLSFIICQAFHGQAQNKIEANPINVAVMLTQDKDTAAMASTCIYYGYTRQQPQDGYTVFLSKNGAKIRYKLPAGEKYPIIEVKSKASQKEKDKILKDLNFVKNGSSYERKSSGFITRCSSGHSGYLVISRQIQINRNN